MGRVKSTNFKLIRVASSCVRGAVAKFNKDCYEYDTREDSQMCQAPILVDNSIGTHAFEPSLSQTNYTTIAILFTS